MAILFVVVQVVTQFDDIITAMTVAQTRSGAVTQGFDAISPGPYVELRLRVTLQFQTCR